MAVILAIFLGLVLGITEFIPVSDSGHMSLLQNIMGLEYSRGDHMLFRVLLHIAAIVSIYAAYRQEMKLMLSEGVDFLKRRHEREKTLRPQVRLLFFILVGNIPFLLMLIFFGFTWRLFYNTAFVGFAMIVTGAILYVMDKYIKTGEKREKTMTFADAAIIGLVQAVAMIPGLSRPGTTIAVGAARGLSKSFAVRYSLFLSLPALVISLIVTLFAGIGGGLNFSLFPIYLVGAVVAAVVGYFSINILRKLVVKSGGMSKFAYYCWVVGALTIILTLAL